MIQLEVYSNNYIKNNKPTNKKVIVLDLDETIGSFGELYLIWSFGLSSKIERNQQTFNDLLDLYPEFLRYGILNIIDYLKYKKETDCYYKTIIYTNNVLPIEWVKMIINYIENRQNAIGLFDKIIPGFDKSLNCIRTTRNKTHSDLIRCAVIPRYTEICFVDDTYFKKMEYPTVYYIQPKRYNHMMKTSDIIERFAKSKLSDPLNISDISDLLYQIFIRNGSLNTSGKTASEINVDIVVSKKMLFHIKEFFIMSVRRNNTRKIKRYGDIGRFTRKKL
jgi:hypothetical protein